MKVLALIPARGGSKRVHRKNLYEIDGRSLVDHAIEHALGSKVCDRIVVSTDDREIGLSVISREDGCTVLQRPTNLAQDDTPMFPVVEHAHRFFGEGHDLIVLLQPTSPLRTSADVAACVEIMKSESWDSVVSVTEGADDIAFQVRWAGRLERLPKIMVPNGAIYVFRAAAVLAGQDWYAGHVYGYQMPKDRSLDVDTAVDLDIARRLLEGERQ